MNNDINTVHCTGDYAEKAEPIFNLKRQLKAATTVHKPISIIIPHRQNKMLIEYNINNSYQDLSIIQMVG
jgi:hypothetical protein